MNRKLIALLVSGATLLVAATGITTAATGSVGSTKAKSADAPTVPEKTIKYAYYPCCADTSLPIVGIRQGFFKDVGITIDPQYGAQYSDAAQTTPAMQRKTYDISTNYIPSYLSALQTFGQDLPASMLYDVYLGDMILKAPDVKAKTATDYMKQGMSYHAAAAKAMAGMKGATIYTDPFGSVQPPYYDLFLSFGGLTSKDVKFTFLADTKTLSLSQIPGRIQYAFPLAAPILVIMLHNGWKPMISVKDILEQDPKSKQAKTLSKIVGSTGLQTQIDLQAQDHDTLLRFISAMYRSIAYVQDPKTGPIGTKQVADVINASQGTKLTAAQVDEIYKSVDPLFGWDAQGKTLWNPKSAYYSPTSLKAQLDSLVANGTMKKGDYDLSKFLSAKTIYNEMKGQQTAADALFKKAAGMTLSADQTALLNKAKQYYKWYDFMDAQRFAQAAVA